MSDFCASFRGVPRRLGFAGTPQIAVPSLRALVQAGFEVSLVVTNPDRRRGRGSAVSPSPVKVAAQELGLTVSHDMQDFLQRKPEQQKPEQLDLVPELDMVIVVAFGQLIPQELLTSVPFANLHFSLLPKWRGAAPLERAILNGDKITGISLMALEPTLDTGPIYSQESISISKEETLTDLRNRMADMAADLLVRSLQDGLSEPTPQVGKPTWAKKIISDDLKLDWLQPASQLARVVRLGGAWTTYRNKRIRITQATASKIPANIIANFTANLADKIPDNIRFANTPPGEMSDQILPGQILMLGKSKDSKSRDIQDIIQNVQDIIQNITVGDTSLGHGNLLVAAGNNTALEIHQLQPEGKKQIKPLAWSLGAKLDWKTKFGI